MWVCETGSCEVHMSLPVHLTVTVAAALGLLALVYGAQVGLGVGESRKFPGNSQVVMRCRNSKHVFVDKVQLMQQ